VHKYIKKIVMFVVLIGMSVTGAEAENAVKHFLYKEKSTGGRIDKNEMIFVYKVKELEKEKDLAALNRLKYMAQKQVCQNSNTHIPLENAGKSIKFIYLYKDAVTIVRVDNCKGIKL